MFLYESKRGRGGPTDIEENNGETILAKKTLFYLSSFIDSKEILLLSMGFTASRWKSSPQA